MTEPMLIVENVTKTFGGLVALDQVSFKFNKGEIIGLIGPNGAGKTTLFNVITGFYKPDQGKVFYRGKNITGLPTYNITSEGIGRTFQIVRPLENLTVFDNALIGAFLKAENRHNAMKIAYDALEYVGLVSKIDQYAGSLNLAEKKKLELAKILTLNPQLLFLDEVAAGLNESEINEMIDLIKKLHNEGKTIVLIEHVMLFVMGLVDRIIVLNYGKKIADGSKNEVANDEKVIDAYLGEEE